MTVPIGGILQQLHAELRALRREYNIMRERERPPPGELERLAERINRLDRRVAFYSSRG